MAVFQVAVLPNSMEKRLLKAWSFLFMAAGLLGLCAPEFLMRVRGVVLSDEITVDQRVWINGLQQVQALNSVFAGGLHLVMSGSGVDESLVKTDYHTSALRSFLRTDAVWAALSCGWVWTQVLPRLKADGWGTTPLLAESGVIAVLGLVSLVYSRGDRKTTLGGLVQTELNGAELQLPSFVPRNFGFLFWGAICAASVPPCLFFARPTLRFIVGDFLGGASLDLACLLLENVGLYHLLDLCCIVAVIGSGVIAFEYAGTRFLWIWSGMRAAFCAMALEGTRYFGLTTTYTSLECGVFSVLLGLSYYSMGEYSRKNFTLSEKVTGRSSR